MDKLINTLLSGLFDVIRTVMEIVLDSFVGRLMYYAETGLCKIVGILNEMFQIFAGIATVEYNKKPAYLVNVFFTNRSINNVYWAMALIGIAMAFGFAIAAVMRKMFDSSGKMQTSLGQILTALLRSIFLILGMSGIMTIVLNSTNVLMYQINMIFNDSKDLDLPASIVYTDEQYAAMGRALNTIGNYALNPSYSNRYNINACFNEIRVDLSSLERDKVFRYYYTTTDQNGNAVNTWQGVLQKIANSHDLNTDLKMDVSYPSVNKAILEAMEIIKNDASFRPLESYQRVVPPMRNMPIDRYLFLMGTMHAAKNSAYNAAPGMMDAVRGPYYLGEKNIYDISQVSEDFDVGFATDYLIVFLTGIALIFDLVTIILNCIARIFNMLFLYVIAPPIFATQPFDGGGKTKQWLTAFIVQAFSVFGTVIAMHLLLIMLPIVVSSELVLFPKSGVMDVMAKLVLVYGLFEVTKKATGLLTGILADSAGWQSVQAGDMSGSAGKLIGGAKAVGMFALKTAGKGLNFATKPLQNYAKSAYDQTLGKWENLGKEGSEKAEADNQVKKNHQLKEAEKRFEAKEAKQKEKAEQKREKAEQKRLQKTVPKTPGKKNMPKPVPNLASKAGGGGKPNGGGKPKESRDQELARLTGARKGLHLDKQGNMIKKDENGVPSPPPPPKAVPSAPAAKDGQGEQGKKPKSRDQELADAAKAASLKWQNKSTVNQGVQKDVSAGSSNTVDALGKRRSLGDAPQMARRAKDTSDIGGGASMLDRAERVDTKDAEVASNRMPLAGSAEPPKKPPVIPASAKKEATDVD